MAEDEVMNVVYANQQIQIYTDFEEFCEDINFYAVDLLKVSVNLRPVLDKDGKPTEYYTPVIILSGFSQNTNWRYEKTYKDMGPIRTMDEYQKAIQAIIKAEIIQGENENSIMQKLSDKCPQIKVRNGLAFFQGKRKHERR